MAVDNVSITEAKETLRGRRIRGTQEHGQRKSNLDNYSLGYRSYVNVVRDKSDYKTFRVSPNQNRGSGYIEGENMVNRATPINKGRSRFASRDSEESKMEEIINLGRMGEKLVIGNKSEKRLCQN